VLVIAAIAAGLLAAASAGAASNGQIAMVDSDAEAGLSAILLIPTDRLATRANSKVLVSGPGTISNIQWTPDGKTLVYDEFTRNRTDLYAVDVANHKRRLLVANLPGGTNGALSPDGKTIAYWLESGLSLTVYLVGTDGQSRRKLTAGFDPVWSSDSSRLALVTTAGRIETIGADGSGPQTTGRVTDPAGRVIDPSLITTFAWAPDGQSFLVAYFGGPLTASVIETIASDGRVLRVLSKTGGRRRKMVTRRYRDRVHRERSEEPRDRRRRERHRLWPSRSRYPARPGLRRTGTLLVPGRTLDRDGGWGSRPGR
jgi:hypothetical protein